MAIEKISTKTNLKEWMNTINELIDSDAGKLNSSDNAVSASKLLTARTINGTSFNGTKNITTANWGTARNITISDDAGTNSGDAVSVNGSANVTLKLPATIKATLSGNASTATTATKANQLTTARTIDGVSFNGTGNITHFGTCSTEASVAAKAVSCSGFTLATGARIIVRFTVTNSASSPTLNVNSTGAKAIVYRNAAISASYLAANRVYEFVYDGTNYELIGDLDSNTDTKVTQTVTTTNAEYPILASVDANKTTTSTTTTRFDSGITLNPGTNTITAGTFKGALSGNASTASKATSDSLGQNIADTYVKSLSVSGRTITITKGDGGTSTITTQDTNTDTKVTQTVSTTNNTYPILACATANATATTTTTSIFCKNIKINPSAGSITATAVYNAVWNDYAEFFPRGEETEPGDIIALDENSQEEKYVKATKDSILIVGSHSNTFGHLIGGENPPDGQDFVEYNLPKFIPVGLAGRVNVKFKGKSKKGYPVTISEVPGVAELCDFKESKIIGYVVEDTNPDSEEIRLVKILIKN